MRGRSGYLHRETWYPLSSPELLAALLLTFAAWSLPLGSHLLLKRWIGGTNALFLSFLIATFLALATRPGGHGRPFASSLRLVMLGFAVGCASYPASALAVAAVGAAVGLTAAGLSSAGAETPMLWAAAILLAPVFEELIYRDRLLPALDRSFGAVPAVVVSSLLFAAPHLHPWPLLTAFLGGLALGATRLVSGSVALCIGLHGGFNAAAIWARSPALWLPASVPTLVIASLGAWVPGCALLSPSAHASKMQWEGTLGLEFVGPSQPPMEIRGVGVAAVNGSAGGVHLSTLRFAGGLTGTAATIVTDPGMASIVSLRASVTLGTGTLLPFAPSAPPSQPQLTQRTLPVRGVVRMCRFFPGCGTSIPLPLTASAGRVGLGVGGLLTANGFSKGGGPKFSLEGSPWTIRSAGIPITTPEGETITLVARGWRHGPFSFTSSTALAGGSLSLVTPVRVTSSDSQDLTFFSRLTVRLVPEPEQALLLLSGVSGLALIGRSRMRR
jgi:membrane protease YdiL (CAAX protease family)